MSLTAVRIEECAGHEELFHLLSSELQRLLPEGTGADLDQFLARTSAIPIGLRAMAATYELDVSLALDDLGWHFANWHHRAYCEETLWALKELEAKEEAEIFERGLALAQPYWSELSEVLDKSFEYFVQWYPESPLETVTMPLTQRFWELQKKDNGLFGHWTRYARKYPHNVVQSRL